MSMPRMVVFDLDACLWDPEVYLLNRMPNKPVTGEDGRVVGASDGSMTVQLHPGAVVALNELRMMPDVKVAAASTSLAPPYSYQCLKLIEVSPGVSAISCFDHLQIGRSGKLTSRKTSHFKLLHQESGIPYSEMLFFDDCNWDDHVNDIYKTLGVVGHATPNGLQVSDWREGIRKYNQHQASSSKSKSRKS
eukprot:TRINITY_DN1166_c1_g1_i1.p1 TRINITY_DN1166_c1_g1~~TRINITY_DN1166_c1_g1_i1.p1  ORF type:complete len:191 (+),score=51.03 TRINITY_DN1166_c1_g1_i1:351-923(+)